MELDLNPAAYKNVNSHEDYLNYLPTIDSVITYAKFFEEFILKNQACLIKNINTDWKCSRDWISVSGDINFDHLYKKYSDIDVTVYNCAEKYYNSQKTFQMKFEQYLVYWESYRSSNYSNSFPILYLKDWHLKNLFPDDDFYKVPLYFSSDWLNEYLVETGKDDYRFVYMGSKGTWTPFHADVFNSYSWSVNIKGKKRWILLPPGEENSLKDQFNNLPYDISSVLNSIKHFEIIQEAGDGIFVPSGWYHQVWNTEDTISVNHNWINGCNLKHVWQELERNLENVKKEIADCKDSSDFLEETQIILNASFGMDFYYFYEFIKYIAIKRLDELQLSNHFLSKNHIYFDLHCITIVLALFIENENVKYLFKMYNGIDPNELLIKLQETMKNKD